MILFVYGLDEYSNASGVVGICAKSRAEADKILADSESNRPVSSKWELWEKYPLRKGSGFTIGVHFSNWEYVRGNGLGG